MGRVQGAVSESLARARFVVLGIVLVSTACTGLTPATATAPRPNGRTPAASGPSGSGVVAADLDALWARQLMVPVAGIEPSDLRNDYEARRGNRLHLALDLLARKGTPVIAADDGHVGRVGKTSLGGNIVYATSADERFVYYYAHLDRHARGLSVGKRVRKGDVLGYVGTTGNAPANAPHLHFQVMKRGAGRAWWDGPAINPWPFFVYPGAVRR